MEEQVRYDGASSPEQILNFSCELGRQLLQNGAEIYRVEDSLQRLLAAYGYAKAEIFAIPFCIILTIQEGDHNYTKSVRIQTVSNNLRRLNELNALCRALCRECPPMGESWWRLKRILGEPVYPPAVSYLAHGMVAAFFTLFWGGTVIDALLVFPCGLLVRLVVTALARVPFACLTTGSAYYVAWLVFLYVLIALGLLWRGPRRALVPVCGAACTLCAAMLCTALTFRAGPLTAAVLDVGQGSSAVLRLGGAVVMVDCGGDSYQNPGDVAADYLSDQGVGRVDLLVLTHYHDDHANGIPRLLERVEAGALAVPDVEPDSPLRAEILALAEERGIPVRFIREDVRLTGGGDLSLTLFAPFAQGETNEEGLTVLASVGDFDLLITGDMDGEVEQLLLDQTQLPDLELLVAGHHGSKYSTTQALLDALRPEEAVISVGADNLYGHPAPETLDRLESAGVRVWRTDCNGTVTLRMP